MNYRSTTVPFASPILGENEINPEKVWTARRKHEGLYRGIEDALVGIVVNPFAVNSVEWYAWQRGQALIGSEPVPAIRY